MNDLPCYGMTEGIQVIARRKTTPLREYFCQFAGDINDCWLCQGVGSYIYIPIIGHEQPVSCEVCHGTGSVLASPQCPGCLRFLEIDPEGSRYYCDVCDKFYFQGDFE